MLGTPGGAPSPVQHHPTQIVTETFWAQGELETLGNPNFHINKDDLTILQLNEARIAPWGFTALPTSRAPALMIHRDNVQLLYFEGEEARSEVRSAPRQANMMFYLPLIVVRGSVPLMSEADPSNFMDFWKGAFVPVSDAGIHLLADGPGLPPQRASVVYIHRGQIQGYFEV
jgi:hypothetical protein